VIILTRRHVIQGAGVLLAGCGGSNAKSTGTATPTGTACELTCAATIGPCYAKTIERKDISEGVAGLATRLSFVVVDLSCTPLANAEVDVWHAAPKGVYSGDDAQQMCTANDPEALKARFFRGKQKTDAQGRVEFQTRFPGWYRGRTTHVHFTVRIGGQEYVTSQLGFDDALTLDVIASTPGYKERGKPDTMNGSDGIIGAKNVFDAKREGDGIVASKTLVLRSSTGQSLCNIGGAEPPPGRPPPPR
jgi:protocatechuate 3,4-dioxygenase beta subunit